jgi:hypothetical protein
MGHGDDTGTDRTFPNHFGVQLDSGISRELASEVPPKPPAFLGSSRYDDTPHQHFARVGGLFSAAFHVLKNQFDGFANVRESYGDCLSLRIAARKRKAHQHVAPVVRVWLQKHFEIACSRYFPSNRPKRGQQEPVQLDKRDPSTTVGMTSGKEERGPSTTVGMTSGKEERGPSTTVGMTDFGCAGMTDFGCAAMTDFGGSAD